MVTSDERRKVAAFLRNNCVLDDYAESLSEIVGYEYPTDTFDVAGYLADLIDPTCEMEMTDPDRLLCEFTCSRCGFTHEVCDVDEWPWDYCPNCGARVVRGDE